MKKPSTKLELYRSIAEYTYDWESWIRPDGALGWVNPAVERITGYSVEECLGMKDYPFGLIHPEDRFAMRRLFRLAAQGGMGNDVEFRVVRKDGAVRWCAVSFQPLLDEAQASLGYRASVRDIHDRKEMEAGLEALRARAEAGDRAKTELIARVSHELRTPIHCISGYAELLERSGLDPERARHAEVIREQAQLLLRQVEDLLDMAALERGGVQLEHESFSLAELVERQVEAKRPLLEAKGLVLEARIEPVMRARFRGDAHRLGQVIRNILENAIKYTEEGGIELDVSGRPGLAGVVQAAIVVRDTGVGIAEADLPAVKREFVRASGAPVDRAGKGLGLAIADRLLHAMGGTLTLESKLGEGTKVTILVPLEVEAEAAATEARAASAPAGSLSVASRLRTLVVDDTPGARELLVAQLERLGHGADAVGSGVEALRRVFREDYDLLLLDLWLPDIPGDEVAERVAKAAERAGLPRPRMVAVTASGAGRHGLGERGAIFDAVLPKPLSLRRLEEVIFDLGFDGRAQVHAAERDEEDGLVDLEIAADLLGSRDARGETLLFRYLEKIAVDAPAQIESMKQLLSQDQPGEAARRLHSLVGLFAVVGARGAAELGRSLLSRWSGGRVFSPDELDRLAAVFDEARQTLERWARERA